MDWYLVWLEVLILACTFIHTQFLCVRALKALAKLSATFKHLSLIDNMISIQNHTSLPIFLKKNNEAALFYIEKLYLLCYI